ncbi:MAG: serine/threonine protein kinase [Myxococcales bacterium]|nr:serine/threonine protein kinase [Myxococcales bacterium]
MAPSKRSALPLGAPTLLRPGLAIDGRYRLLHPIGKGGQASVYAAFDTQASKNVAIKVLLRHLKRNADATTRFAVELEAAQSVRHEALVEVYGHGDHAGLPYITMELVEGTPLSEHLHEHGPLSPLHALQLAHQVAGGLARLHEAGVVHRDVKPANLIIRITTDGDLKAKVTDFGYARIAGRSHTAKGFIVGTASYMAPEQVVGEAVDGRTDVYALGVTLYYAVTGEVPFVGRDHVQVMAHHVHTEAPAPSKISPETPPTLDRIVGKAMRKHPNARYQTMQAMLEEVQMALKVGLIRRRSEVMPATFTPQSADGVLVSKALADELP